MLPRTLRGALTACVTGLALALTALVAAPDRAHASSSFTLYDNTSYNDANLQANYGLTPSGVVYDSWSITCANTSAYSCSLPPESDFQAKIKFIDATIPATSPLVLDFEGIDGTAGTAAAQENNNYQAWLTLLSWTRAVIPSSQPLGIYGYDYDLSALEITHATSLHQNGATVFVPSLYTHSTTASAWTTNLTNAVANDQTIAPSQPIYPYIWPQWDISGKTNTFIDATTWASELSQLQAKTQGAVIWSGPGDIGSGSCGWIGATHDFMTGLTGTGGSTGSLTASVTFPSTCTLTRGRTTSVPITVTNSGNSASAATTLSVTAGSGISGTPAATAVPALAAGGTWSTTVAMTVGSSASPGDTVIAFNLGSYVQNRTAVIEDPDLAQGMTATQSSTNGSYTASLAVDGTTDPAVADGSVSQTGTDARAWWQVDLGSSQSIGSVALWNSDAATATKNYYLVVSDSSTAAAPTTPIPPNQWTQTSTGVWAINVTRDTFRYPEYKTGTTVRGLATPTVVPAAVTGRYVRVQLAGSGPLSLAEVQVRPYTTDSPVLTDTQRLANGGFESGSVSPWTGSGTSESVVSSPALAGAYALKLGAASSTVEQVIAVTPGTTYTLSGFGLVSATGNQVEIGVKGYGGSQLVSAITATAWTQGSVSFTTGSTTTTATVFCYHDTGTGTASCDDLTVTAG
ncbi:carbohydrate binding domain-containing protein [Streptacidiphilus sp. EB103A]|uniref:galactose-binding domain-containing protein n=1 Tax=Streptacidiphilus sp. EB103A TaxID=3156275 RepID=UPI0035139ADD